MCRNTKSLAAARRPRQGRGGRASILTAPLGVPRGLGRRPGAPSQARGPHPTPGEPPPSQFPERGPAAEQQGGEVMGGAPARDSHPGAEGGGPEGRGPRPGSGPGAARPLPRQGLWGAPRAPTPRPPLCPLPEGWGVTCRPPGAGLTFRGASSQERSSQKTCLGLGPVPLSRRWRETVNTRWGTLAGPGDRAGPATWPSPGSQAWVCHMRTPSVGRWDPRVTVGLCPCGPAGPAQGKACAPMCARVVCVWQGGPLCWRAWDQGWAQAAWGLAAGTHGLTG